MSAGYKPVSWTLSMAACDAVLLAAIALYLLAFLWIGPRWQSVTLPPDGPTLAMQAYGSCC